MQETVGKTVFLDRDGVINHESAAYVRSVEDWRPIPGSLEAMARLSRAGRTLVVLTNQSGLGRGLYDEEALEAIHARLSRSVADLGGHVRAILHCPHRPEDACRCRKPAPGLIERAERELGVRALGAPLIGDRLSDLQAGLKMGCEPFLVRTGHGEETARGLGSRKNIRIFADLAAVADALLSS
jgi:D-glycero-D-manno-heptose 1,7-bisphosphate phosphatase